MCRVSRTDDADRSFSHRFVEHSVRRRVPHGLIASQVPNRDPQVHPECTGDPHHSPFDLGSDTGRVNLQSKNTPALYLKTNFPDSCTGNPFILTVSLARLLPWKKISDGKLLGECSLFVIVRCPLRTSGSVSPRSTTRMTTSVGIINGIAMGFISSIMLKIESALLVRSIDAPSDTAKTREVMSALSLQWVLYCYPPSTALCMVFRKALAGAQYSGARVFPRSRNSIVRSNQQSPVSSEGHSRVSRQVQG